MLEFYGDVIVMRHFQQGAPHEAAKWSSVPIINGGDGWGEHPTQILTDLYTVLREKGRIDGLTLGGGRRHAHAHHALAGLRAHAVRLPDHVRRPDPDALFPGSPDMRMPESSSRTSTATR